LTSQIPPFKMTIVGSLPWGSSGHHKSKNPVNNHDMPMVSPISCFQGRPISGKMPSGA